MAKLTWRPGGKTHYVADLEGSHYVITFVTEDRDVMLGDVKVATKTVTYYELEANGEIVDQEFGTAMLAAEAASDIEKEKRK